MKIGDIVQRKLGGCLMTVGVVAGDTVETCWFDDSGTYRQGAFQIKELRRLAVID